jgi:RIO kinase 2
VQITDDEELTLIDFPQMVSTTHPNARDLFERDVQGVVRFFERKLGYLPDDDPALQLTTPSFEDVMASSGMDGGDAIKGADASTSLDAELRASGWKKEHEQTLDRWVAAGRTRREERSDEESGSDSEEKERSDSDSDSDSTSDGPAHGDDGVDEGLERASCEDAEGNAKFHENDAELAAVGDRDRNEESDEGSGEEIEDSVSSEQGTREDEESFGAREWVDDKRNPTVGKRGAASSLAGLKISDGDVAARTVEERRRAARRSAAAKASRNATKSKNKGKKKGSDVGSLRPGGGW